MIEWLKQYDWFTGYGRYHPLWHCMDADHVWIASTLVLCAIVAYGYLVIASKWKNAETTSDATPNEKQALRDLRRVFVWCMICSYAWPWVDLFWPAWRLKVISLAILSFVTIRYAFHPTSITVVYRSLDELSELRSETMKKLEELKSMRDDFET